MNGMVIMKCKAVVCLKVLFWYVLEETEENP